MAALAIYALTPAGAALGRSLAARLPGRLFLPVRLAAEPDEAFERLGAHLARSWSAYRGFVMICAAGIAVRAVAPLIAGKDRDPAVVVLDQEGRYVVSLLSGHLGGAIALARQVAELTGGSAVITTATDTAGLPAIDLLARRRSSPSATCRPCASSSAALLAARPYRFRPGGPPRPVRSAGAGPAAQTRGTAAPWPARRGGVVDWHDMTARPATCACIRVCSPWAWAAAAAPGRRDPRGHPRVFRRPRHARASIRGLASIEAKSDEPGLLAAARELGVPWTFYPADQLGPWSTHASERVRRHMGVPGRMRGSRPDSGPLDPLVVPKTISAG
jgi:cobalt-precorrin 5A hydrolase